ncbi:MAG TPA: efflux RND transporter periplasmic adaptor subunit [Terriglobales bacterium]|nr:efflux RND transporter periplasmic adaptor subunit [Terriglobales bacterium]
MQSRKTRGLALILLGTALLPWLACSQKSAEVIAAPSPAPAPSGGSATGPTASDIGFAVSGPLIVEHQLDVLAQREGVVTELRLEAGAHVQAGDLLAQLDDRQLAADLEAARAKTHSTEADLKVWQSEARVLQSDYDRAQKMWDAQLITREQLDHAKFKAEADAYDVQRVEQLLVNAQQTQRSLELELDKTQIRAPFSGVVARRYVRQGQQVAKGDRLFWVTAEGPLQMRFTLPEKFIGRIQKGQELPMMTPDLPDQKYKVRVVEVSPVVDPASSTIEVTVELEGKPGSLRAGMDASVSLQNLR